MSRVLPFPRVRHRPFVAKHASNVAAMGETAGERYLGQQLQVQRQTMLKRGIAPDVVDKEVKALELGIRAALWRIVLTPGGAA